MDFFIEAFSTNLNILTVAFLMCWLFVLWLLDRHLKLFNIDKAYHDLIDLLSLSLAASLLISFFALLVCAFIVVFLLVLISEQLPTYSFVLSVASFFVSFFFLIYMGRAWRFTNPFIKIFEFLFLEIADARFGISRNVYDWYIRWRFFLVWEFFTEQLASGGVRQRLRNQRWVWTLLTSCLSGFLLWISVTWLTGSYTSNSTMSSTSLRELIGQMLFPINGERASGSAGAWSVFSAILLAPLAFVLWIFRDTNQLWLIENNRKDTNLKDFQN